MAKRGIDIAGQLSRMPAQPFAAGLILRLVDDPDASPAQLAQLVEMDPVLSARVMRLANSPHYAARPAVTSASRAVVLLGFTAVRGIAAAAASSLLSDDIDLGPTDYWAHSISVAAAASVAADVLGVAQNEAFSAGLLHDLGCALLHRADPALYKRVCETAGSSQLESAERDAFGESHSEAGAEALSSWHFPKQFVQAVATHHHSVENVNALAQAVILGQSLAERIDALRPSETVQPLDVIVGELGFQSSVRDDLLARARQEIIAIGTVVGSGR